MVYKVIIDEEHFDAAHYLPKKFGKCFNIHGHRWHLKNIRIFTTDIIDFSLYGKVIDRYDHCLIIPEKDINFWAHFRRIIEKLTLEEIDVPCNLKVKAIPYNATTCEELSEAIKTDLIAITGVVSVSFILYETDTDGIYTTIHGTG